MQIRLISRGRAGKPMRPRRPVKSAQESIFRVREWRCDMEDSVVDFEQAADVEDVFVDEAIVP
ncbi:hypothetical protein [Amycolatopsis circi]|uniref:hypothetical protein n=1 Tax=Amycolatopsis circi TaxID=871959 RepID=UPI0013BEA3D3|nr:hypothetical protein [Amycolatopsis circi]